ncbi:MAG: hypothetical protein J6D47_11855 [Peptostreptococcaceae bacterium]|nr:hypothetical protein [Peptostreptococcaceae bacterium]
MKKIDKYIDDLFGNDKSPEIIDLKEEIKGHLIDMANEFINDGLNEEEAFNKAIKKFNIDNEILKKLYQNVKENNKKLKESNRILSKSISITKLTVIFSLILFIITLTLNKTNTLYNMQSKHWMQISQRITDDLSKFAKSRDINNISQYESELKELLKSEEFKSVSRLNIYDNGDYAIFSEPKYSYEVKNATSSFETASETSENNNGQVWHFRLKLKDFSYITINNTLITLSLYTILIFSMIYITLNRKCKKYKKDVIYCYKLNE